MGDIGERQVSQEHLSNGNRHYGMTWEEWTAADDKYVFRDLLSSISAREQTGAAG